MIRKNLHSAYTMKQKPQSPALLAGQPDFREEIWDGGAAEL